jgi:hypothetical protein
MNKKEIKILENLAESSDFHDPAKQNGIEFFLDGQKKLLSGFSLIPVSFFFFFFFLNPLEGGVSFFCQRHAGPIILFPPNDSRRRALERKKIHKTSRPTNPDRSLLANVTRAHTQSADDDNNKETRGARAPKFKLDETTRISASSKGRCLFRATGGGIDRLVILF